MLCSILPSYQGLTQAPQEIVYDTQSSSTASSLFARNRFTPLQFAATDTYCTKPSGTMSNYEPLFPTAHSADPTVKQFITDFFKTSDNPELTDEWVDFFREDATLVMGSTAPATGRVDIRKLRVGMWEHVEARRHTLGRVFPVVGGFEGDGDGGEDGVEFMMFGKVDYKPRDADAAPYSVDFAGHARLVGEGLEGRWGFAYYRVYLQR
ncbi:hypothetical protein B0T16DRAFT_329310 [Cercophora newfieldiana]|uniref:SnoaL-like domain-containing protein n=1 Tax=Cercophora newfieldiana TaxID=92897 RepID=A0AA39Y5V2_9PEZI|nr:hypothetical protein B0T16DRAFT_329310 [Cercophora newfieldiana]